MLYRRFAREEIDVEGKLDTDSIRLPDLSCNWAKFSEPDDVKSLPTDGCYRITVADARYDGFATVVHDPLCDMQPENYSHCEIRQLAAQVTINCLVPRKSLES